MSPGGHSSGGCLDFMSKAGNKPRADVPCADVAFDTVVYVPNQCSPSFLSSCCVLWGILQSHLLCSASESVRPHSWSRFLQVQTRTFLQKVSFSLSPCNFVLCISKNKHQSRKVNILVLPNVDAIYFGYNNFFVRLWKLFDTVPVSKHWHIIWLKKH